MSQATHEIYATVDGHPQYLCLHTTRGKPVSLEWLICSRCGRDYREDQGGFVDGKFYGFQGKCFEDAQYDKMKRLRNPSNASSMDENGGEPVRS